MSVEAISWALNLAPVPADSGGQPFKRVQVRARRPGSHDSRRTPIPPPPCRAPARSRAGHAGPARAGAMQTAADAGGRARRDYPARPEAGDRSPTTNSSPRQRLAEHTLGTTRVSRCPAPPWLGALLADGAGRFISRGVTSMRKKGKIAAFVAAAAVVAGVATPATAAAAATGRDEASPPTSVAFSPGSGQSVVDWNKELITILGTPGLSPRPCIPPVASRSCRRPSMTPWCLSRMRAAVPVLGAGGARRPAGCSRRPGRARRAGRPLPRPKASDRPDARRRTRRHPQHARQAAGHPGGDQRGQVAR